MEKRAYGKIGLRAFTYYMITTFIAAFTGIALALFIQPGKSSGTVSVSSGGNAEAVQTVDSFLDLIRCGSKSSYETEQCVNYRQHLMI